MLLHKKPAYPYENLTLLLGVLLGVLLGGCTNSFLGRLSGTLTVPTPTTSSSSTPTDTFVISSVSIQTGSSTSPNPTASGTPSTTSSTATNIFFNTTKSTAAVSAHCNVASAGQTSKPCLCQFTWAEVNPNSGLSVSTKRNVQTVITQVQPNLVTCPAPPVYTTEIISGTQITITVLPSPGNPDATSFTTTPFLYSKSPTTTSGSFQDAQGHVFDNIIHYSCYNKFVRGLSIQSKNFIPNTNSKTGAKATILYASNFCLTAGGASSVTTSDSCPSIAAASNSAQSYYFNLYIRNSEKGDINKFNDGFVCPTVQEPLNSATTIGNTGQFWPMDTNFALSLGATTDFPVGVQANTKLSGGSGDPTTANSQCFASSTASSSGGNTTSIVSSCLGFAAAAAPDGTCPSLKSASGQILQTFRLRRFVALYPRLYDTTGLPAPTAQAIDTIYVLDRPIHTSSIVNPLKPYTMLGPKPCPFAFFDKTNVASGPSASPHLPFGYRATNDEFWRTGDGTKNYTQSWTKGLQTYYNKGTNVDGLEFPNWDDPNGTSCSAAMPFPSSDGTRFYMATVNKLRTDAKFNHLYIRPFTPFTPHYEEDTAFVACAPQANPYLDPPLHLMRSSTASPQNYAWCAESYPSQNPNITSLDPPLTGTPATIPDGRISPYTSHIVTTNGATGTIPGSTLPNCIATAITLPSALTYAYPAAGAQTGYAKHGNATTWGIGTADKTCDRSVVASTDVSWTQYPLLAPAADVENALQTDSSYNCSVTYDNGNGFASNVPPRSPSGGCCLATANLTQTAIKGPGGTHIEPSKASQVICQPPNY